MREKGEVARIDRSRAERVQRLREQGLPDPAQVVLAERQAAIRATYERSIAELSASPSMVNQMVAKSVGRFVAAMPAPEPNSVRAARGRDDGRGAGSARMVLTVTQRDELAAAMAQLRAAAAQGQAIMAAPRERELEREREDGSGADDRSRAAVGSDRMSSPAPLSREETDARDILEMKRKLDQERDRIERYWERKRLGLPPESEEQAPEKPAERAQQSTSDRIEEILREVRERDRAHREQQERDRSRDRGRSR